MISESHTTSKYLDSSSSQWQDRREPGGRSSECLSYWGRREECLVRCIPGGSISTRRFSEGSPQGLHNRRRLFLRCQQLSIVTCDEGAVRMYEYDPHSPESNNGQNSLYRTKFHSHSEYRSSTTIARRMKGEDVVTPQAKSICGHPDGSLTAVVPVDVATFKHLHLFQGQITRNVQHIAGIQPRAFRLVRNDCIETVVV